MGSRQVVKGICPEKKFGPSNVRKNFLNVRKKCFNPLNGTLTHPGGGGRPKYFPAGRHRISQGTPADTPPN